MRSRYGLKVLGLCVLAVGLLVIPASGAQAAKWRVNGVKVGTVSPEVLLEAELKGSLVGSEATLLATVNGLPLRLKCTTGELINVKLKAAGALTEGGKVKFSGCDALNGTETTKCEPHSPGKAVGVIETTEGKGQLVLHETAAKTKEGVTRLEPKTGTTFVVVEMGAKCAFGEEVPIKGVLFVKDTGNVETEAVTHTITELTTLSTLTALNNSAKIDGSANVVLTGTGHAGLNWSGLPE